MLNRCEFIGNLVRDPESMTTQSGVDLTKFAIAVSNRWKDKEGMQREETEFIDCVAWRGLANVAGSYTKKGSKVYVAGKFKTEHWEKDGVKRKSVKVVVSELVLLDKKSSNNSSGYPNDYTPPVFDRPYIPGEPPF